MRLRDRIGARLLLSVSTTSLVGVLPEISAAIPAADREQVERVLRVPVVRADGELAEPMAAFPGALDFIIAGGIVLKRTRLWGRDSLELFGPGDVLAPPLSSERQVESRALNSYETHREVSLAVIEDRFRLATRRWPQLSDVLHDRLARQTHRASMHVAMLHIPRAEDRVVALFSDLAERFGRVTGAGIVIEVELTHAMIGRLVGSRRPTVSLSLDALADRGILVRTGRGRWMLNEPDLLQDVPATG
jgi:CRP-like cAMP-binding protein